MTRLARILLASVGSDVEELKTIMIFAGIGLLASLVWLIVGIDPALLSYF